MEKNDLISVIIPIYKVEKYLNKCIDSIIQQTYKNLEIILIDDGSPDNCGEICDNYALIDHRISVIHKVNGGLSDARNAGLEMANGDYIIFVDSDDWMEKDGIYILYDIAIKYNADLVIGGVEKIDDSTGKVIYTTNENIKKSDVVQSKEEAIKDMLLNGCASWARLYKRSIHKNVLFPVGEINEDEAIVLTIYNKCNVIVKTDKVIYKYRYRKESITSTTWHIKKMDWYYHAKENYKFINNEYSSLKKYAQYRYCISIIWCLNNMTANKKKYNIQIKQLRSELKNIFFKVVFNQFLSFKEIIRGVLLIYFYEIYSYVINKLGKHYT